MAHQESGSLMIYFEATNLNVQHHTYITEEGGVVVSPSCSDLLDPPVYEFGVNIEGTVYADLWKRILSDYPSVLSITLLGDSMIIQTRMQEKARDTTLWKSEISDLIRNLETRIANTTNKNHKAVLTMRKSMLSGLL